MPDRVAYLAQTRHTRPAREGKTGSPAHWRATEPRFGLFCRRPRRPSASRVRLKPSIPSVCNGPFRTYSRSGPFDSQEVTGES